MARTIILEIELPEGADDDMQPVQVVWANGDVSNIGAAQELVLEPLTDEEVEALLMTDEDIEPPAE